MFREFVADCKAYLQDSPANIVMIVLEAIICMFFNVWGLVFCGFLYVVEEEPVIYQLLPETENERRRRRIFNVGMEMLLLAVLITVNLILMHGYNQSMLLQFPNLFLLDAAYCIYLFYHRICRFYQTQNKMWSEKPESYLTDDSDYRKEEKTKAVSHKPVNSVYEGIVFVADKVLIVTLILCIMSLFDDHALMSLLGQRIYVLIRVGLGIGFVILLVDVIRQTGGRKYED